MIVVLGIIGFWLICALVAVAIWQTGDLFFVWVCRGHARFSLRTLLSVTTLAAVVLGMATYAARKQSPSKTLLGPYGMDEIISIAPRR
jgi:hypothetical protein